MNVQEAFLDKVLKLRIAHIQNAVITNPEILQMVILYIYDLILEIKLSDSRKKTPMWDIILKRNNQYVYSVQVADKKYFDYCVSLASECINNIKNLGMQEFLRLT